MDCHRLHPMSHHRLHTMKHVEIMAREEARADQAVSAECTTPCYAQSLVSCIRVDNVLSLLIMHQGLSRGIHPNEQRVVDHLG